MTRQNRLYEPDTMKSRELRAEKLCYGCGRMVRGIWQEYTCDNVLDKTAKTHDECRDNTCNPKMELLCGKGLTARYLRAHDAFEVCGECGEPFTAEPECSTK